MIFWGERLPVLARLGVAALLLLTPAGCDSPGPGPAPAPRAAEPTVELTFLYGSEKKGWLESVTKEFNRRGVKTPDGKRIVVKPTAMGSGEAVDSVLSGQIQADLLSPASGAFFELGNLKSREQTGADLVGATENLVVSPVVIAMWKPMAEALGWPDKPIGWSNIIQLANDPKGWASLGHPEWGRFKFGHTHPRFSNSGLIAVLAECYAAAGKQSALTVEDLDKPAVREYLSEIEQSVVHYGSSTGFFAKKMFANGPDYLSAAVMYESNVVESYSLQPPTVFPVVAIYPKEGTFWSDHPAAVVERPWVTPAKRAAARQYLDFLLAPEQQKQALRWGFRPADVNVPVGPPIDAAHGVNPDEPKATLPVPPAEVVEKALAVFQDVKKPADVALVLDISGSMKADDRLERAKEGARLLVDTLEDRDNFSLILFNHQLVPITAGQPLGETRQRVNDAIAGSYPTGGTALYDAVLAAYQAQSAKPADRILAVVVLSDGADRDSQAQLRQVIDTVQFDGESRPVRIFTISYGNDADEQVLGNIAEATKAKNYKGTPKGIAEVFRDIATFF